MSNRQEGERRRAEREAAKRVDREPARRRQRTVFGIAVGAVAVVAVAVLLTVAGNGDVATVSTRNTPAAPPLSSDEVRGVPPQIRANLRHANQVIDGNVQEMLASLKGVPVVVNQWASWCPNCRAEFGFFAELAKRYRAKVAFLGLDSQDGRSEAEAFLREFPVEYPSIYDEDASQARSIGAGHSWPTTVYYDADGNVTFVRQGSYASLESLDADLQQYALKSAG
jgi:thiol-disulfide isomerase/thioredoxin